MIKQKANNIPDWQWLEVVAVVKQLAVELKAKLKPAQWQTVELMLRPLLQDSQQALTQHYADSVETLFASVQEQLNLLEDFVEICLL